MAYTSIDDPTILFNTVLYTGNGGTQSVTGVGFQPDWIWIKNRSNAENHALIDSVRGVGKQLISNATGAEYNNANSVTAFGSDGFSVGNLSDVNNSSNNIVAWNWKAGTSFSNDASATSVGTIDSTGSINTDAGFSIISYTGTGSAGTVAHGLGVAPKWYFTKNRDTADNWLVYHEDIGNTKGAFLNVTNTPGTSSAYWNNTSPTSTVFSVGTEVPMNKSGDDIIAYCFAEKQGYSKFGKYTGNANTNGPFVYTGFRPAWIMVKATDASKSWYIWDSKRAGGSNLVDDILLADTADTEFDGSNIDILSNGFKLRGSGSGENGSGTNYIYMAFAEQPFVNSNGVPCNAR